MNILNVINGANIKYLFRVNTKVLAAYAGQEFDESKDIDGYQQFTFDQIKMVNDSTDANNQYFYGMKNGYMHGASSGIPVNQATIVFRNGKESSVEVIKKFLYDKFLVIAPHLSSSSSSNSNFSDFGFDDFTDSVDKITLTENYEESQFYNLSNTQLPSFDLIAYATKPNGEGVIAKKEYLGIKILGDGSGDEVSSVESNDIISVIVSYINDWVRYESDLDVIGKGGVD